MASPGRPARPGQTLKSGEMICPEPSKHDRNTHLQEQASTAALLVTGHRSASAGPSESDTRLSSGAAASSLRHAKPQDLASFPVVGVDRSTSAGKAAILAASNQSTVERWKPEASSSAGRAALLAHREAAEASGHAQVASSTGTHAATAAHRDTRSRDAWAPESTTAGSSAAMSAQRDSRPVPPIVDREDAGRSRTGNTAANLAMSGSSRSPPTAVEVRAEGQRRALIGATGAFGRRRADSTPAPDAPPSYPDEANSRRNALNAATVAHRPSSSHAPNMPQPRMTIPSAALEAARVRNIGQNVDRQMWTEHPPVAIEVDEQKRKDALRASSVSMAKTMYDVQAKRQKESDERARGLRSAEHAAISSSNQDARPLTAEEDLKAQAVRYLHVQEAAQRLAEERLAKIMPDEETAYRQYYGYGNPKRRSRLSVRGRTRQRSSSEGAEADSDDEDRSHRIRAQMSTLNEKVALVDEKKRLQDRRSLMAAAEKLVQSRMHKMDEKVYMETGKVPPSVLEDWEAKAKAKAAAESESRMVNHGKVHIGGGKYLDQATIDAVAAARVQPTLDQIADKAEKQRARDEEIRLDEEEKKRQLTLEREQDAEMKQEQKRAKEEEKREEKAKKEQEKQAQKNRKAEEKAQKAEEKRLSKGASVRTKDEPRESEDQDAAIAVTTGITTEVTASQEADEARSPKGRERIRSFVGKLKRMSKSEKGAVETEQAETSDKAGAEEHKDSSTLEDGRRSPSLSSVSDSDVEEPRGRSKTRDGDVSDASGKAKGKETLKDESEPEVSSAPSDSGPEATIPSPGRDSKFTENL